MDSCRVKETAHRFGLIEFVVWLVSVPPFQLLFVLALWFVQS